MHNKDICTQTDALHEKGTKSREVLAIIPARGGSKGLPGKNIKPLCGRPLIDYTIAMARAAKNISRVVVSTDDEEIARVARACGAETPFLRPKKLSGDNAIISDAVSHTISELYRTGYVCDARVIMYPTHPFRKLSTVEYLVDKLLSGYQEVTTYIPVHAPPLSYLYTDRNNELRQLLDHGIHPGNNIYFKSSGYLYGVHHRSYQCLYEKYAHTITDPLGMVDIDSICDFYYAEEIIKNGLYSSKTC